MMTKNKLVYISDDDLEIINDALTKGCEVKIRRTKTGVKILRESSKVLKEKDIKNQ